MVVFDKTGTLTKGTFSVIAVVPCNGYKKDELLRFAAEAEAHSNHPIALSICKAYGKAVDDSAITEYEEISGFGVKAIVEGKSIIAGNDKLLHREHIAHTTCHVQGTVVHLVVNRNYAGFIVISDEIRENTRQTIETLRRNGVAKQIMLTGDNKQTAALVSKELGLDGYYAELLPQDKVKKIEDLLQDNSKRNRQVAFVGDGINDAPVIARADIGIAMGALGSDAAIEAADIVLMTDDLTKLNAAMHIAKRTRIIVWQNIGFALGIKAFVMGFALLGMATMWEAIFADMGAAILAILNASRTIRSTSKERGKT
jgi:Cd2+/Zn2+-exporting ATPase